GNPRQVGTREGEMGRLPRAGQGAETPWAEKLALHGRLHDQGRPSAAGRRQERALMPNGPAHPPRMWERFAALSVLAAALCWAAGVGWAGGASAEVPFTSPEGGYSVAFPAEPRETVETRPDGKIFSYMVRQNDAAYGTSHVEYKSDLDVEQELQANAVNFADAL